MTRLIASIVLIIVIVCAVAIAIGASYDHQQSIEDYAAAQTGGGNPRTGRELISLYGCASCHTIPGIHGADAHVGPPLDHIAIRSYIGVGLRNNPQNMMQWIQHARDLDNHAAMPNLHINQKDARDIAAYLYTLK